MNTQVMTMCCDECGKDWTLRPKTQWTNGHCLLARCADPFGNLWTLCNRCFKLINKEQRVVVVDYIKPTEEEDDEE
jgi:predicted amidophosphoribosyltransferase